MTLRPWSACVAFAMASALTATPALSQEPSVAGVWKNIDDRSGKPRGLIRIVEVDGELVGRIEQVFPGPDEDPSPRCALCAGALQDQPLVGLPILRGFRREGSGYGDGTILDPESGQTYRCRLALADGGRRLNVRGYVGVPWLGRSQVWLREP
jgi:uncharacterized protein (DUF2147 family)